MAMEKIKEANIQKLFIKVFTMDGSAKSLLVDEKMLCSYVTRLLADKNHVQMDPKWAIVEHLPDLYMGKLRTTPLVASQDTPPCSRQKGYTKTTNSSSTI